MPNTLTLNCLVLGEDIENIFALEIADTQCVSDLKNAIKEKKPLTFQHVEANTLHLYNVSFLIDNILRKKTEKFVRDVVNAQDPLLPADDLSELFFDAIKKHLHVVAKVPPKIEPLLDLWCYVLDDDRDRFFLVKIASTKSVRALKYAIKKNRKSNFNDVPADDLDLYSVSIPLTKYGRVSFFDRNSLQSVLLPRRILSEVFSNSLSSNHIDIHIVVDSSKADLRVPKRRRIINSDLTVELEEYVSQYWNIPLEPHLTNIPENLKLHSNPESSDDLLPGDVVIRYFFPHEILIRAEYIRAYSEMESFYTEDPISAIIVTGQRGIGKTEWTNYAVRRRLGEGKPVLWYRAGGYYFLSGTDVWEVDSPLDIPLRDLKIFENVWLFIDDGQLSPLPPTICDPSLGYFIIYVSSPNEDRWKHIEQVRNCDMHLMRPWTRAEIEKAALMDRYNKVDLDKISERFGPKVMPECLQMWFESRDKAIGLYNEINY